MYGYGGVAQDYAEAARFYRLAAAQGNASALNNLGSLYGTDSTPGRGVAQDWTEAVRLHRLAAAQGLADAYFNMGEIHLHYDSFPLSNPREALKFYRLALAQGHERARQAIKDMRRSHPGLAL